MIFAEELFISLTFVVIVVMFTPFDFLLKIMVREGLSASYLPESPGIGNSSPKLSAADANE